MDADQIGALAGRDLAAVVEPDRLRRRAADRADGGREIALLLEGMHCGACVWLLESWLARQPGVREASVNYQKAIQEEVKSTNMRDFKWENVQEFVSALADYEKETPEPSLHNFLTMLIISVN